LLIHLDDKKLVKQLLAGDERAFSAFFDDYFPRLYRFALTRLSNDPEGAREVTQIAMCKAVRRLESYRGEAALFTWLCTICRNAITDWLRKQGRYRDHIVLIEDFPAVQAAVDSLHQPLSEQPDKQRERQELVRLIQVALDRLPAHYGNVLEWKYIEGYSVKEIAQRLDLGTEATQSLLARAKRAFSDAYTSITESMARPDTAKRLAT
jgi:RNA polymerase sigma-70 factor (ECF subfamily)